VHLGDTPEGPPSYSSFSAGTHPTNTARSQTMLHQELGRERMVQIRSEVEHNRLESRLSKNAGLEKGVSRRSLAARSAAVLMSLFR
jgi:hypothetical protein